MSGTLRESSDATRRVILHAAARLFDARGYAGTSISAISRHAGLTSGAVYFHFSGKDDLARCVVEEHFASWPAVVERIGGLAAPMLDKVLVLSFEVARAFRDDVVVRAGSRLWTERRAVDAELPRPFIGWIETLTAMLREGIADGSVDAGVDPAAAASVLVCAFFGTHTVSDALDDRRLIEDWLTRLWEVFLPSLRRSEDPADVIRRALASERLVA